MKVFNYLRCNVSYNYNVDVEKRNFKVTVHVDWIIRTLNKERIFYWILAVSTLLCGTVARFEQMYAGCRD